MNFSIRFEAPGLSVAIETDHEHNIHAFAGLMFGQSMPANIGKECVNPDYAKMADIVASAATATAPQAEAKATRQPRQKKEPPSASEVAAEHAAAAHALGVAHAASQAAVAQAAPAQVPAEPTPAPAVAPAAAPAVSRETLTQRFFALASKDMDGAKSIIEGHGVKKFSLIPDEKLGEVDAQLKAKGF